MLKNYVPSEYRTVTDYNLVFDDGCYNGFGFPCDAHGELLETEEQNPVAYESYRYCLQNPDRFERFNVVVKRKRRVRDNAHGICFCGNEVELYDQYLGACQCEKCGRWYNLFGQELLPPEQWEECSNEADW